MRLSGRKEGWGPKKDTEPKCMKVGLSSKDMLLIKVDRCW